MAASSRDRCLRVPPSYLPRELGEVAISFIKEDSMINWAPSSGAIVDDKDHLGDHGGGVVSR
jgi:hypothetical protein